MSEQGVNIEQFDAWLTDASDVAALVMRQWLVPVEGEGAVIFPPTYAKPQDWPEGKEWLGYNIDGEGDSTVCQIDSVGSQANRMEPIFKREPYSKLVPQVTIKAGEREVHLLDAGHRAADGIVRYSGLERDIDDAFKALKERGDAKPLAKLAPTSLVFGVWDSRVTQVKFPRIVRSVIRAFNVRVLHRSAQYVPPIDYVKENLLDKPSGKTDQDRMAELGLSHAPAPWTHGGIRVLGEIRRDATLNLSAIRALATSGKEDTLKLRRYILGLALVSFTAPQDTFLREGCQLVPDPRHPAEWNLVRHDGTREQFSLSHDEALQFAQAAAQGFGVGPDRREVNFNPEKAKSELKQSKNERKEARRRGAGRTGEEGEE